MHNFIIVYGMHNSLWNFVLSLLNLTHLTLGRERHTDIVWACCFQVITFWKTNSWKMEVLQIFGSFDQKIDLWFTNHKSLIPTR